MLAAAKASDVLVLCAAVLGVLVVLTGLASFDGRVRSHVPLPSAIRDRAVGRVAMVVVGLVLVNFALA